MAITVKRAETTVDFCSDLSLRADWEAACDDLDTIRKRPGPRTQRLAEKDPEREAAEVIREIEDRMDASILRFKIRALQRKRWQELGAEHGPRDGNDQDAALGVDTSTFFDAVAKESIYAVVEKTSGDVVDFDPKIEWDALADEMTDGQYNDFAQKFLQINRSVKDAPFSRAASLATQNSEETSTSPTS